MSARRIGGSGEIWLNANELPFAREAMQLDVSEYHRYPDQGPDLVQAAYASYAGLHAGQVLALRGADEAIDLLLRAYCRAGEDKVLVSSPTYGMYQVCADIQNAEVVDVPLTESFQLDVAAICARQDVKLVFICSPNNPTGNYFAKEDIITILNEFSGQAIVAIDEAYIEFCLEQSLVQELSNFDHLVVIRTMSKAFGLAGVHVGYLLANEAVMSIMRKVAAPYPLADPCAQIALLALDEERLTTMNRQIEEIHVIREEFCQALENSSAVITSQPSAVNFVLVSFHDAEAAWQALIDNGIVPRRIPDPRLENTIRFTIGTSTEMNQVVDVINKLN